MCCNRHATYTYEEMLGIHALNETFGRSLRYPHLRVGTSKIFTLYKMRNPDLRLEKSKLIDVYFLPTIYIFVSAYETHAAGAHCKLYNKMTTASVLDDNFCRLALVLQASLLLCHYERMVYLSV
jgi:hypothetical protein